MRMIREDNGYPNKNREAIKTITVQEHWHRKVLGGWAFEIGKNMEAPEWTIELTGFIF